jgi:hypothetical protein
MTITDPIPSKFTSLRRPNAAMIVVICLSYAAAESRAALVIDWVNRDTAGFPAAEMTAVDAAIAQWSAVIDDQGPAADATFEVTFLRAPTSAIGAATAFSQNAAAIPNASTIRLDDGTFASALGGFFVDPSPLDHSEFMAGAVRHYGPASAAAAMGRIDFLSVVVHELGHALGFAGAGAQGYSRWSAAHGGTTSLDYGAEDFATLFDTSFNGLAHLRHLPAQPLDLMATAGDLPTGGIGDRRVVSQLDLDILAGVYGYAVNPDGLLTVPEPATLTLLAVGLAIGGKPTTRRRHMRAA